MDPILSPLLGILSLVFMKDHYEYLQDSSQGKMNLREKKLFSNYRTIFNLWLLLMQGVTLVLASVHPAMIFIILYFYINALNLIPQLLYRFFPNLNFR